MSILQANTRCRAVCLNRIGMTSIMENRRRMVDPKLMRIAVVDQVFRDGIKRSQHSLLKHRHYLKTGIWPGEA